MATEIDDLVAAAITLADAATAHDEIRARARRLVERLSAGRFHISVLGEFKRGKSTLINALLGADILPTGVLPLTAVITEVSFGDAGAVVEYLDGHRQPIALGDLAEFVTESGNPANERNVARVCVTTRAPLLAPGVVLVDTPGIGSIFHHDETAARALLDADGAILVLSSDAPLSERERGLLAALAERRNPTFYVLNKVDHVAGPEVEELRRFVGDAVSVELGHEERLWCVAARAALQSVIAEDTPTETDAGDFAAFIAALKRFIDDDLVGARVAVARRELARVAHALDDAVALHSSALRLRGEDLARRVVEFESAAADEQRAFADQVTLLDRDVAVLDETIAARLFDFARSAPTRWQDELDRVADRVRIGRLEHELRGAVEAAVEAGFEEFRRTEAAAAERHWRELAEGFREQTESRVNAVRAAASGLFAISLPDTAVPEVAAERERFFYLFLNIDPSGEAVVRFLRRVLLPPSVIRGRLLRRARNDLAREFDKHAGRARWDVSQRLDAVRRRFEAGMRAELDDTVDQILSAARSADELRHASEANRQRALRDDAAIRQVAASALAVTEERRPDRGSS
ncbi:MAG TPA: dynamin family protein [Acidimicrobiales bacterium]|nr:dynamin family protein [Acidimicrobiales bacterium]